MKDNRFLKKVYLGYKKEALDSFVLNKFLYGIVFIYYYFAIYKNEIAGIVPFIVFCVLFELISCFLMYDTYLRLYLDKKQNSTVKQAVELFDIRRELSNTGNRGYSRIGKFFDKNSRVQRYRIYYKINDKKKYVRTVLEFEQMFKLHLFIKESQEDDFNDSKVEIEYFTKSKVLKNITSLQKGKLKKDVDDVFESIFQFKHN